MKFFIILFLLSLFSYQAIASDVIAHKGETLVLPIDKEMGTLIEFPVPLKLIPASSNFKLGSVTTQVDPKTGRAINVNIVNIRPRGKLSHEKIPFLLSNGKTIYTQLLSRSRADRHYKIKFLKKGQVNLAAFLSKEIVLMKQMLKDEPGEGFSRSRLDQKFNFKALEGIKVRLKRRFKGQGLIGYTFHVSNFNKSKRTILPKEMKFENGPSAVLMQIDNPELESCRSSKNKNKCSSALRVVLRGSNYVFHGGHSDFPFTSTQSKGGKQ